MLSCQASALGLYICADSDWERLCPFDLSLWWQILIIQSSGEEKWLQHGPSPTLNWKGQHFEWNWIVAENEKVRVQETKLWSQVFNSILFI